MMKAKHAHPLRAMTTADRRMLRRRGVTLLYALIALACAALIRFVLPEGLRQACAALLSLFMPMLLALYATGMLVIYEKSGRLHAALYASGAKARTYLASKCGILSLLGALTGCFIIWFASPAVLNITDGTVDWRSIGSGNLTALWVAGVCALLISWLVTCLSLPIATLCRGAGGFLIGGLVLTGGLIAPAVMELIAPLPEAAGFCPTVLMTRLMTDPEGAAAKLAAPVTLYQCAALAGYLVLGWIAAERCADRLMRSKEGTVL